ncbi:MAG: GGDEF domain-containing phosphodiesterase [Planctomycetota bacterium]
MDDLTPPSIPDPKDRETHDDDPALARVDALHSDGEPEEGPEANDDSEADVLDVETWTTRVEELLGDASRQTLCRILVPGLERVARDRGDDAVDDAVDATRRAVQESHTPEGGVTVARGEELVLVLPDGVSWAPVARTVAEAMEAYFGDADLELPTPAVGLAEADAEGNSVRDAIRLAGLALNDAKSRGGGARAFRSDEEAQRVREADVMQSVAASLSSGEGFRLVYQPKFALEGNDLIGAEALLRHDGGPLGPIGPAEFIPLARRFGLLGRLDRWVLEKAVAQIAERRTAEVPDVPISVNVGPTLFFSDGFPEQVTEILEEHGVDAEWIQVEVRAPDAFARLEAAEEQMAALRARGVSVALDDFGQEDVAAADLRRLPVDAIKVHRTLILDVASSESAATLVEGVMSLAKVLGIETVAAGVEEEKQLELLRSYGCDAVQGFMLCPPLESEPFIERLRANGGRRAVA